MMAHLQSFKESALWHQSRLLVIATHQLSGTAVGGEKCENSRIQTDTILLVRTLLLYASGGYGKDKLRYLSMAARLLKQIEKNIPWRKENQQSTKQLDQLHMLINHIKTSLFRSVITASEEAS